MNKIYFFFLFITLFSCKNAEHSNSNNASVIDITIFGNTKIKIDSALINNSKDINFKEFYKKYNYQTAWNDKSHRDYFLNEIANAENEGLEPKDYNYQKLKNYEDKFDDLKDSIIVKYDFLLTNSASKYINHISKGKLNPKKLYEDWDLKEKTVDANKILFDCIDNNNFKDVIENCKPTNIVYKKLKTCLSILKKLPGNKTIRTIDLNEKFLLNKTNKYVSTLKETLLYWGDLKNNNKPQSLLYDKETQEAVKHFQARHGLKPDAIISKSTIEALNFSRNQRIEQVIANMERWRWFAHDFGNHYLLVNIPDYNIVAVKDKDTTQYQRVVVGKESRPTPILESKISNINLNPNWTVPPTILKEDIFPQAIKNKGVFKKKGLTIYNFHNQLINPSSWKIADAKKYKYVQKPSRNNSLGLMKINFPNNYSVYLHDTNHRNFFDFTFRSLSSGCVRLEKPLELAAYILNDTTKWSLKKIVDTTDIKHYFKVQKEKQLANEKKNAKLLAKNPSLVFEKKKYAKPELKTIVIPISEDIFIHQLYWTAWENNNILQFREDIYCLDSDLYSKLRY